MHFLRISALATGFFWAPMLSLAQDAGAQVWGPAADSVSIHGYVSSSYHILPGPGSGNHAYAFSGAGGKADRFALDVVSLTFEHPLRDDFFDSGFKAQFWIGPDAGDLMSDSDGDADAELSVRNAYIDLRLPFDPSEVASDKSVDLRLGVFETPIGRESVDRSKNRHVTHSWGFTLEPTLHTGLLLTLPSQGHIEDQMDWDDPWWRLRLGVANTHDARINGSSGNDDRKTLLLAGSASLGESSGFLKGTEVSAGYVYGRPHASSEPVQNLYLGLGRALGEKWTTGLAYDARLAHGSGNDDSVLGLYLGRELTPKLDLFFRGEWFEDGAKLFENESAAEQSDGVGLTVTLDYQLWEGVRSRLEWRWDKTDAPVNGRHHNQAVIANFIYEF